MLERTAPKRPCTDGHRMTQKGSLKAGRASQACSRNLRALYAELFWRLKSDEFMDIQLTQVPTQ